MTKRLFSIADNVLLSALDNPPNSIPKSAANVTGLFAHRSLISPAHFPLLAKNTSAHVNRIVRSICYDFDPHHPTKDLLFTRVPLRRSLDIHSQLYSIAARLDRLSDFLCRVIDLAELVRSVHPQLQWREAAESACAELTSYMNVLNTHSGLYRSLKTVLDCLPLPSSRSHDARFFGAYNVALQFLRDFEKSGIHLPPDQRQKFVQYTDEILRLGMNMNSLSYEEEPVNVHLPNGKKLKVSQNSTQLAQLRWHHDESVRKAAYIATYKTSNDRIEELEEMLRKRCQLARLIGYENWGQLSLVDKMAKSPSNVSSFIDAISTSLTPGVKHEIDILRQLKQMDLKLSTSPVINEWDKDYYQAIFLQSQESPVDPNLLSPYLSLGTTFRALSYLFQQIYGLRFSVQDPLDGELWDPWVRKVTVYDDDDRKVGTIYLDLFWRNGKTSHPAHYTVQCSRRTDLDPFTIEEETLVDGLDVQSERIKGKEGTYQLPIVVLVCGFGKNKRVQTDTVLLTWSDVTTLFHEMGHAIHSMLGQTDYHNASGTRCATDFVELPSILMEHFITSPSVLSLFTHHLDPSKTLPVQLVQDLDKQSKAFLSMEDAWQVTLSALDQAYHSSLPLSLTFDSTSTLQSTQNAYSSVPYVPGTHYQTQFVHLVGYSATYYSYLFDRAIASKVWSRLFVKDPLNREMGEQFKEKVLRWGGAKDPWELVADAVGGDEGDKLRRGDEEAMAEVGRWGKELASNGKGL